MTSYKIKIGTTEYTLVRLTLRGWAGLEKFKAQMDIAISKHDFNEIFSSMVSFIEMAIIPSPSNIRWSEIAWYDFVDVYSKVVEINSPTIDFPILRNQSQKDRKKLPWEYEGRAWYFWLNLFAKNYGWDEEKIANLDIDTAIGIYQEISIDDQLEKEWEWGLSEIAYPYNKSTKKSEYKPLQRPSWMMPMVPKQLPVVKIKKSLLPVGNIIDVQAEEEAKQKEKKAKRGA